MTNDALNVSRRSFLQCAAAGAVAAAGYSATGAEQTGTTPKMPESEWSQIRGFNYQPSYGSSGFELWQKFDAKVVEAELTQGKKFFPKINCLRWWQSWDSFLRDPKRYASNFETALTLADKVGCRVVPCLFNRWHDAALDYGGIYIDHFWPQASWVQTPTMFDGYLRAIVGGHKDDPRIAAWDLCNEPYSYSCAREGIPAIVQSETAWLKLMHDRCKENGAKAPITVGIHPGVPLEMVDPICDLLSIHPYFVHNAPQASREAYEQSLDRDVAFALKVNKPLLSTECCWGATDDKVRVESVRYTLEQLKRRNIGWLVYLLHHSLIADAHRAEFGPLSGPGNLAFIEADGTLRPGHEVFNEF
jgi:hypothetical protein